MLAWSTDRGFETHAQSAERLPRSPALKAPLQRAGPGVYLPLFNAVNLRRLIITLYLLLFLSVAAGSGVFFWQTRREYNHLRQSEALAKTRLAEAQEKLREQERILDRLRNDPAYVEMVIRRRLGYAKPDERIFRFLEADERNFRIEPKR